MTVVMLLVMWDNVKVDTKDDHGYSLLSYAAEYGCEVVVKILVGWDEVQVNTKDDHGYSPPSYTAKYGCEVELNGLGFS